MAVGIIEGVDNGGIRRAVLWCTVSDTAFGPLFKDREEAEAFLEWADDDPRRMKAEGRLEDAFLEFINKVRPRDDGDVTYYDRPKRRATRPAPTWARRKRRVRT